MESCFDFRTSISSRPATQDHRPQCSADKYEGPTTKFVLRRIKQARSLTGLQAEVLISELGGHASARGAIQEANLN